MRSTVTSIVRQLLTEHIQAHQQDKKSVPKVYILLVNPSPAIQVVWEHIESLDKAFNVSLGVTNEWSDVPQSLTSTETRTITELNRYELLDELSEVDLIYIPVISYGLLAKIALTIDDDLLSWLIIQSQLAGKSILFADDGLQNGSRLNSNTSVESRIQSYRRQLRKDGVDIASTENVHKRILKVSNQRTKKTLLSTKQIETLSKNGEKEIYIPKNKVITPLAKDRARELGITIHQEGHEKRK